MKINIVLNRANRSWILQKIAENLARELSDQSLQPTITETPNGKADVVHHMSWAFANTRVACPSSMFITHLDDSHKVNKVQKTLRSKLVDVGVCMSRETMEQLAAQNLTSRQLYFITPACDGLVKPRRVVIGITTRLYADGRKREKLLEQLAEEMRLDAFEFRIFGSGWGKTTPILERAGAEVRYFDESDDYLADYKQMTNEIPHFDYYLYLGLDEGSLGTLDALCAGIPTIVTPQGFHLDLPHGITHPVIGLSDLKGVFMTIEHERSNRISTVKDLTWKNYALEHAELWRAMINQDVFPSRTRVHTELDPEIIRESRGLRSMEARLNAFKPRRILSAVTHMPLLQPLRSAFDRFRIHK